MARTNGSTSNGATQRGNRPAPYYERLAGDEQRAEYGYRGDHQGEVRVYDDRDDVGQRRPGIVLQTFQQTNKGRKAAVLTFESADEFREYLDDLAGILADFEGAPAPAVPAAKRATRARRTRSR